MFSRLKDLTFFDIVSWICMFGFANGVVKRVSGNVYGGGIFEKAEDFGSNVADKVLGFIKK